RCDFVCRRLQARIRRGEGGGLPVGRQQARVRQAPGDDRRGVVRYALDVVQRLEVDGVLDTVGIHAADAIAEPVGVPTQGVLAAGAAHPELAAEEVLIGVVERGDDDQLLLR